VREEQTAPIIWRRNWPVRKKQPTTVVRRGNRSVCRPERVVAAPIGKQCNTQKKRTTNKFFHGTFQRCEGILSLWYLF
jgi:hypothetical protein